MRSKFLVKQTRPIAVGKKSISRLLEEMKYTGHQAKELGTAFEVWQNMLQEEEITILMGLAGAMTPAGMRKIIAFLIKSRMIDVLVSTGANIFHELHEALGKKHYVGSERIDDEELYNERVDRIYNVFADEIEFRRTDRWVQLFIEKNMRERRRYSTREFCSMLGKYLCEKGVRDSILAEAYRQKVPIFIPAICDSSLGYSFLMGRRGLRDAPIRKKDLEKELRGEFIDPEKMFVMTGKKKFVNIDQMKDVDETVQIAEVAGKTGVIYIGGGVPKNFIQQAALINLICGISLPGHEYAVQFVADPPHWGGLSGCTFDEAKSWGKIARKAKMASVLCDATIALPLIAHGLYECGVKRKKIPFFKWKKNEHLEIEYRKR